MDRLRTESLLLDPLAREDFSWLFALYADAEVMRGSLREVGRIAFGIVALIALFPVVVFYLPMRMPTVRSRLPDARGRHLTTRSRARSRFT